MFALVTGTSSGLGQEIAYYLLDEGYTVFGASRSGSEIEHGNFVDIVCDIGIEQEVENLFNTINETTDQLDLIINNAGICYISPLVETSSKEFLEQIQTNTLGTFHILKHALNFIIENQTHIVTITSTAGKYGYQNASGYSASKFALHGLIDSLRKEWKELGVRFSTLCPGAIDTPFWEKIDINLNPDKSLNLDEFMYVFQMVVNSPVSMQFPEITFLHKNGVLV